MVHAQEVHAQVVHAQVVHAQVVHAHVVHAQVVYAQAELDRDPGAAGIPAGIWRFCPGPGPGRDFVFSRDFSRDFSKIKSVFERKFEPKFHEPVNIFRKVLLQQCSTVLLNS